MAAKKGAPKPSYSKGLKEYVVQFLKDNSEVKRSQIAKSSDGRIKSLDTVNATDEIKIKIAHFWNQQDNIWKTAGANGAAIDFTNEATLPLGYILVGNWLKADRESNTSDEDTPEESGAQDELNFEDEMKAHNRHALLLKYKKDVYDAKQKLKKVDTILKSNPDLESEVELDEILKNSK